MRHITRRQAFFLSLAAIAFLSSISIVSFQTYRYFRLKREIPVADREYARYYKRYMELYDKEQASVQNNQNHK